MNIEIKRVYEPAADEDSRRVLVDWLWPRGVSRQNAQLDVWLKDIAPSSSLRMWFGHKAENFEQFSALYQHELDTEPLKQSAIQKLLDMVPSGKVTLLYGAKSTSVNHAAVLKRYLEERLK
jgi:uncharacterized protein YeaO (DUF488 family)